jgi:amino acid transporter
VAVFAPQSCRKSLSYITGKVSRLYLCADLAPNCLLISGIGWLCALAWQTSTVASCFIAGTVIQALFILNLPNYKPQAWHGTLLCIAIIFIAIIFNTYMARKLPLVEGLLVFSHILGVVIIIPLLILAPRRAGGAPLVEFWNPNGWSSDGVATLIGLLPVALSLVGFDCSIHMGAMSSYFYISSFTDVFIL